MSDAVANSDPALETCEAVIIGLGPRRWVIVRRGGRQPLRLLRPRRRRVRDLQAGDEVLYNGERQVVRSLAVYA